ncbi:hypothetical protein MtrunA17_Chr3g0144831 [Medicago truncatula]|uniref:Vicilin n=1 Tax=Medicago truncatula TaxID=3880 RepID=G7J757_MEDTR|nr:Vicilin [Medicago truncatula]RHN71307.1 hypothetical protein MtrunA17_Chr3g0144831 [Medicago truncatula]
MAKTSILLVVLAVALFLNGYSAAAEGEGRANQLVKDEAGILNSAAAGGDGRVNQPVKDIEADQHDDDDDDHKRINKLVIYYCFNINKLCGKYNSYCSRYTKICNNIGRDSIVAKSGNPNAEILP